MNRSNPERQPVFPPKTALAALPLLIALCYLARGAVAQESWETVVREENLLVQRRPWPGSALQEIRGETRVITIKISNFPDFVPAKTGFVRVPRFGGFWELQPEAGGQVKVTYQVYGDPGGGGWIPVWAANRAAVLSVTHTLRNMPAVVSQYSDAHSDLVEEATRP